MAQVYEITSSDLENGVSFAIDDKNPYVGDNYLEIQYRKTSNDEDEKIHFWVESKVEGLENSESKPYQLIPLAKTTNFEMTVFVDGRTLVTSEEEPEEPEIPDNPEDPKAYDQITPEGDLWICWYPLPGHHWFESGNLLSSVQPKATKFSLVMREKEVVVWGYWVYVTSQNEELLPQLYDDLVNRRNNIKLICDAEEDDYVVYWYTHYDPTVPFWRFYQGKQPTPFDVVGKTPEKLYTFTCEWVNNGTKYTSNPITLKYTDNE